MMWRLREAPSHIIVLQATTQEYMGLQEKRMDDKEFEGSTSCSHGPV